MGTGTDTGGEEAWFALSDMKDYFYGCSTPTSLSHQFALMGVDLDF
jgi:hypothetical protein